MNDFNIQAAATISGVTVYQIRAWEKRYNAVTPKRSDNNFRSYTQENITRLKLLGALTLHGISISKLANLETKDLQDQYDLLTMQDRQKAEASIQHETKEKLDLLITFLQTKKFQFFKHEVTKNQTFSSVGEILVPLIKQVLNDSTLNKDEINDLVGTLLDQIKKVSITAHS